MLLTQSLRSCQRHFLSSNICRCRVHRAPGSIGQCATPARVHKGKKLPGHAGLKTVSVKNLKVIKVDKENDLVMVMGAVPGHRNSVLVLRKEL